MPLPPPPSCGPPLAPCSQLSDKCARRVFEEEQEEAKDWRVDPGLHRKCAKDVAELCGDADPREEGATTQCLVGGPWCSHYR